VFVNTKASTPKIQQNTALCVKREMSNLSLKNRISDSVSLFKEGKINLQELKSSIEENGRALEMMPYALIKEIDDIEYQLTISEFYDEEECYMPVEKVLLQIENWLQKVPL
jgi:hypothetical protein